MIAIQRNNTEIGLYLLEKGANPKLRDNEENDCLMMTCEYGNFTLFEKVFSEDGVHFRNKEGHTPLMLASYSGNLEIVKILCQNGSNLSDFSNNGKTSLFYSFFKQNL